MTILRAISHMHAVALGQQLARVLTPNLPHALEITHPIAATSWQEPVVAGSSPCQIFGTRMLTEQASQSAAVPTIWHHRTFSQAATSPHAQEGLLIHPSAVQRLKQLQSAHPGKRVMLRIEVEGGGCSGFQYKFSLDHDPPTKLDKVFESEGVQVICDNVSLDLLKGASVEFEDSLMRSAFTIGSNPNSEASCGCGSSFTAKMPART